MPDLGKEFRMRGTRRACVGVSAVAAALWLCAGNANAQTVAPSDTATTPESPLMDAVDRAAASAKEPERARLHILARLQLANTCYPHDLTPQQLDDLIAQTQLLPPTAAHAGPFAPRFFADSSCWLGAGTLGQAGTSRPAQLTYSFPDDGVHWGLTCAGFLQGDNDLGAKLIAAYGSLDRGREFMRSSVAGWRTVAGLTYTEVVDDNSAEDTVTAHVSNRGDIRFGGLGFAPIGMPLAYNAFPAAVTTSCSGGDMTINTNYFTSVYFTNTAGNFLYFRNTVAHEHGHGLGFLHSVPCNQTKLMEPTISTGTFLLAPDEVRAAIRNYGDRYAPLGNHNAAGAKDYGTLTSPVARSVIERDLGINGTAVIVNGNPPTFLSEDDWFKFTIGIAQPVTITVDPTGYGPSGACCISTVCTTTTQVKCAAIAGAFVLRGTCTPSPCTAASFPTTCTGGGLDPNWCQGQQGSGCSGTITTIDATQAGNLALQLLAADGTTVLATSDTNTPGITEQITQGALAPGTYYVRIWDAGGASSTNQVVQTYDMTIRIGTSKAPPRAIAGLNLKRAQADVLTYFMGNHNSYATEPAATIPVTNYAWDLDGDGVYDSAGNGQPQPSFTYRSNGTFNVTLRVTDSNGLTGTDTVQCVVYGATTTVTTVSPAFANAGTTVPVTINGSNFKGVTSASQIIVAGGGVTVTGTPIVNPMGTRITGLSFVLAANAAGTARDVNITNSDGLGSSGGGTGVFTVVSSATTGACCAANGSCTLTDAASCAAVFQGLGSICSPNPCPQPGGACCFGSTCSITSAAACSGVNRRFAGPSTSCNAIGNTTTPCCLANFNQNATLEPQDIFDFLNAWFTLDPTADINGSGVSIQDIFDFLTAWFAGC